MLPRPVDWQKRYKELATLSRRLFTATVFGVSDQIRHIGDHLEETERLELAAAGKRQLLRLRSDAVLNIDYAGGSIMKRYRAGTLFDARSSTHTTTSLYLDDDGDGNIIIPMELVEEVTLSESEIDYSKVVCQG